MNSALKIKNKNIKAIIRQSTRKDPAGVFFELLNRAVKTRPQARKK